MSHPPAPLDIEAACAQATERLRHFISRAAGQHRRAIARGFAELKARQEPQEGTQR